MYYARAMRTLRRVIETEAPMRPAPAIEIALRVLAPLAAMHAEGRAHGDMRAERIAIDAKSVSFLAPENALSRSQEDDVANVASVLYELLTRAPADDDGPASHHNPIALSERLVDVVERARRSRSFTAVAFSHELRVCLLDALKPTRF